MIYVHMCIYEHIYIFIVYIYVHKLGFQSVSIITLQVWKVRWWMGKFGGPTPKPHVGYSNCYSVGKVSRGRMTKQEMAKLKEKTSTTRQYRDRAGRKRWVGTKHLKQSQPKPQWTDKPCSARIGVAILSCQALAWFGRLFWDCVGVRGITRHDLDFAC